MNLLERIAEETAKLGYRADAVRHSYSYSDVWSSEAATRSVPFAAFTQTPPSYRSAAFAVIEAGDGDVAQQVEKHRALGAPLIFVMEDGNVSCWQVYAKRSPRLLKRVAADDLSKLFTENRDQWSPDVIHRAKSIGRVDQIYQRDFVDVGLIPAIEGEIHTKLDRLLREAVSHTLDLTREEPVRLLFRGVFRLLAAKILLDRRHPRAETWDNADVRSVLVSMGDYYQLGNETQAWPANALRALEPVWGHFRAGFNVANISADDLSYVYESTLVSDRARAEFGTHSTPRHVADYVVERLRIWEWGTGLPQIYEPFAGAGVFLGSALRHLRDALPHQWTDKARHELLVQHVRGAEIDPFAAEVAKLSLILADYPNANGWRIEETDLFRDNALAERLIGAEVVLCNPPFEAFKPVERASYPQARRVSSSKAVFALETTLRAKPAMLGFVVPNTLLVDRRYRSQRSEIERSYREVELVALPDGIFNVSQADTALLIARDRLRPGERQLLRSAQVFDRDKRRFAETNRPSVVRELERNPVETAHGNVWLTPLHHVWTALGDHPRLGSVLHGHWGLRWRAGQKISSHMAPAEGRKRGLRDSAGLFQFVLGEPQWLDAEPSKILAGGNFRWSEPKIFCNSGRLSRGYWRLAAAVDREGLLASQQLIGLWPHLGHEDVDLDALAAIINSPVVNAYLAERSFDKRFRIAALEDAPLPRTIPNELGDLSRAYAAEAAHTPINPANLDELLRKIDDLVLSAYNLSVDHQHDLLGAMAQSERPLAHRSTRRRRLTEDHQRAQPSSLFTSSPATVEIVAQATRVFGSRADAEEWIYRPLPALNGKSPIQVSETKEGREAVAEYLNRIDRGVYV